MSTEADIVKRLRVKAEMIYQGEAIAFGSEVDLMTEAADLITKLRAERDAKECLILELRADAKNATRDMRERCADLAAKFDLDGALGSVLPKGWEGCRRSIAKAIRALPDTPTVIATEETGQ